MSESQTEQLTIHCKLEDGTSGFPGDSCTVKKANQILAWTMVAQKDVAVGKFRVPQRSVLRPCPGKIPTRVILTEYSSVIQGTGGIHISFWKSLRNLP